MTSRDSLEDAVEALRESTREPVDAGEGTLRAIRAKLEHGAPIAVGKTSAAIGTGVLVTGIAALLLVSTRQEHHPHPAGTPVPAAKAPHVPRKREQPEQSARDAEAPADDAPAVEPATAVARTPEDAQRRERVSSGVRSQSRRDTTLPTEPRPSQEPAPQPLQPTPPTTDPASRQRGHSGKTAELDAEQSAQRFREIHRLQFSEPPERVLAAWETFLAAGPTPRLAVEARYHRAVLLTRLGRYREAREALAPFARGKHGSRRQESARRLMEELDAGR